MCQNGSVCGTLLVHTIFVFLCTTHACVAVIQQYNIFWVWHSYLVIEIDQSRRKYLMAAQNQERTDVGSDPDALQMAQEAVRAGILSQDVLDCLTSLNPQVPNFMKLRYLVKHLHDLLKNDKELTLRVFQVFLAFHSHKLAGDAFNTRAQDFPLSIEHFSDLAEFLVPYAFQWNSIGIAMRFKPRDLSNIQSSCWQGSTFLKDCLLKLLEDWIHAAKSIHTQLHLQ